MKINLTVEVDAAAWSEEYAVHPAEVRGDVKAYLANTLHSLPVPMNVVTR
jgi:hypothetical protein